MSTSTPTTPVTRSMSRLAQTPTSGDPKLLTNSPLKASNAQSPSVSEGERSGDESDDGGGTSNEHNRPPVLSVNYASPIVNGGATTNEATPSVRTRVESMLTREMLTGQIQKLHSHVSPGLAKLRMTPSGTLKAKQKVLSDKHELARQQADSLHVGGGVSVWPEMEDMRLSLHEVMQLAVVSGVLVFLVVGLFLKLHSAVIERLNFFSTHLSEFTTRHPILLDNQEVFDNSALYWHEDYRKLLFEMHQSFDVTRPSTSYQLYISLYLLSLTVLLYYLMDNMLSANKLSPRRIKIWVTLLVVVATWSLMMMYLLVKSQAVENSVENNVRRLSDRLGDIIPTHLNHQKFESLLLYWQTRCLPPMTRGTLNILGLLPVRDVSHYLQYYSVPVVTVLVTPPAKLIVSLYRLYVPKGVVLSQSHKTD